MMHTLIIGGSRGIGWELACLLVKDGNTVTVTGRKAPDEPDSDITFLRLDLSTHDYAARIKQCFDSMQHIDRLVYAPGYFQDGSITELSEEAIQDMIQVCGTGFILSCRDILLKQAELAECVLITSSSQWTPREREPVYNFAKAGAGHFAAALSLDKRVGKLLVAGPTGTKTAFHAGRDVDMSTYHEASWVASQIHQHLHGSYEYKYIKILRDPAKVEVAALRH
jgi:NAD(P)-dependent dehydrogenase (short-subunit alcohol dehydrogenase family)